MNNLSQRLSALMQDDCVPMSDAWGKLVDDLKHADFDLAELLAYREAQGKVVGWKWRLVDMASSETSAWSICLLPSSPGGGAGFETESIPLYAAPQLPAVPDEMSFEKWLSQQDGPVDVDCGCVSTEAFMHWVRKAYDAGNSPATPDGFVLVPIDATMDMLKEGAKQNMRHEAFQGVWKAMLAAAPKPDSDNVTDNTAQQFESLSKRSANE